MSEQPEGRPAPEQTDPPPPQEAPAGGGTDEGPPAQGEGEPDSH